VLVCLRPAWRVTTNPSCPSPYACHSAGARRHGCGFGFWGAGERGGGAAGRGARLDRCAQELGVGGLEERDGEGRGGREQALPVRERGGEDLGGVPPDPLLGVGEAARDGYHALRVEAEDEAGERVDGAEAAAPVGVVDERGDREKDVRLARELLEAPFLRVAERGEDARGLQADAERGERALAHLGLRAREERQDLLAHVVAVDGDASDDARRRLAHEVGRCVGQLMQ